MSRTFYEYDVVRITDFNTPIHERHIDSSFSPPHIPKIGDVGTIVHMLDDTNFIIEAVNQQGYTEWLCDFSANELEVVERPRKP